MLLRVEIILSIMFHERNNIICYEENSKLMKNILYDSTTFNFESKVRQKLQKKNLIYFLTPKTNLTGFCFSQMNCIIIVFSFKILFASTHFFYLGCDKIRSMNIYVERLPEKKLFSLEKII